MHRDYLYWIWLSLIYGPGVGSFTEVLDAFGDPYAVYAADREMLTARLSANHPQLARLLDKDLREAHRIYDFCVSHRITLLAYGDIAYPARLKTIQNPPILLYCAGKLPPIDRRLCIGVVGTRKMSEYGKRTAYKISYELASAGAVVVSGLALGCDAVAAAGAIAAGGATVAVLGCGIDVVYPRQHMRLSEEVKRHGAIITEFPPGAPPNGFHFPIRNRIISGLSQGTLAVEGSIRSGALLTVSHAVRQGRRVFAVPGNVGVSNSEGTNELIRNGATVVLDAGDVLDAFTVTDKDLIRLDGYRAAKLRSEPDEELLLRLGITSRLAERDAGEGAGIDFTEVPTVRERKRTPADLVNAREKGDSDGSKETPKRKRKAAEPSAPAETPLAAHEKKAKAATESAKPSGDDSEEILASLSERERALFTEMPLDTAIPIDRLGALGYSIGEIMAGLTILEIKGLVTSLPGGLYLRK